MRAYKRKQGDPVSAESLEQIRRLAEMPDELINTDDAPERPVGEGRRVHIGRPANSVSAEPSRKAS